MCTEGTNFQGSSRGGGPNSAHPDISHAHVRPCQQTDPTPGSSRPERRLPRIECTARWWARASVLVSALRQPPAACYKLFYQAAIIIAYGVDF